MASITNAKLTLTHDHKRKTVTAVVTCEVNFSVLELCIMKNCPSARLFRLKCELRGSDVRGFGAWSPTSPDFPAQVGALWTYTKVYFYPDASPIAVERPTFDSGVLGEGVLDEDLRGEDDVYGLLRLTNYLSGGQITKKTNTVHHSFPA